MTRPRIPRRGFLVGIALLSVGLCAGARAEGKLSIGMFCPSLRLSKPSERVALVDRLAGHLSKALGVDTKSLAFAKAGDLDRALRAGRVELVLADALFFAERAKRLKVIAAVTRSSRAEESWVLVSSAAREIDALRGRRIALPPAGRNQLRFARGYLLEGELPPKTFRWVHVPDALSALTAMKLDRADAAFVPKALAGSAQVVVTTRRVPLPRIGIRVPDRLPTGVTVASLRRALAGFIDASSGIGGWRPDDGRALSSLLRPHERAPLLSRLDTKRQLGAAKLLAEVALPWKLSPIDELLPPPRRHP
jgi:ABC-type amino acid transport substrate-binding protein